MATLTEERIFVKLYAKHTHQRRRRPAVRHAWDVTTSGSIAEVGPVGWSTVVDSARICLEY